MIAFHLAILENRIHLNPEREPSHQFLSDGTPILRSAGIGLILPKWWTGQKNNTTLRAKATAKDSVSSRILSLSNLLQVDYEVAMGGIILSREELEALARSRMGLVHNRWEWMEVDPFSSHSSPFWRSRVHPPHRNHQIQKLQHLQSMIRLIRIAKRSHIYGRTGL